ncbi:hypothetical protein HDU93_004304 [Gonapodya sp. JEL0774]|nr:hypothetical protein HDU93_004304 [Gonapodya sp. JEL0774]
MLSPSENEVQIPTRDALEGKMSPGVTEVPTSPQDQTTANSTLKPYSISSFPELPTARPERNPDCAPFRFTLLADSAVKISADKEVRELFPKWGLDQNMYIKRFLFDQPFAEYMAPIFLKDLFDHGNTTSSLKVIGSRDTWSSMGPVSSVKYESVKTTFTDMQVFRKLFDNGIVRPDGSIRKCFDVYHSSGLLLSDLLRCALVDETSEHYDVFTTADRKELLLKCFAHLALGGKLCQYEDEVEPYTTLAKKVYRELVSITKDTTTSPPTISIPSLAYSITNLECTTSPLFPSQHVQNFCYVVIEPSKRWQNPPVWKKKSFPMKDIDEQALPEETTLLISHDDDADGKLDRRVDARTDTDATLKSPPSYGATEFADSAKDPEGDHTIISSESRAWDAPEHDHYSHRAPWLRAAVLGACDGLVSTSSLMVGVIAGGGTHYQVMLAGISGTFAGALSMGCGEYVSVWSMRDAELADIQRERNEFLRAAPPPYASELDELQLIYEDRGIPPDLAREVAEHFHHNHSMEELVAIHARDELGIDTEDLADPLGATLMSMMAFSMGAILPLFGGWFLQDAHDQILAVLILSVIGLAFFGALGAHLGGAPILPAAVRMTIGGGIAMGSTFVVGKVFGVMAGL